MGRTGALNPYAVLEPVEIGGTTVKLATLHNEELIAEKDLRVGDFVQVKRAGEVIPQIIGPVPDRRDGTEKIWKMPKKCPSCGTPVLRDEEEVAVYCPNVECPGRQLEGLVHFASRGAMDIRGLQYERIAQLIEAGLVHDVADLYALRVRAARRARAIRARRARSSSWRRSMTRAHGRSRGSSTASASATWARARRSCSRGTSGRSTGSWRPPRTTF